MNRPLTKEERMLNRILKITFFLVVLPLMFLGTKYFVKKLVDNVPKRVKLETKI
ncbi:MAG: hypothetical protein PHX21_13620 [bacterium]|nr:hypothetical protein [bacterium]